MIDVAPMRRRAGGWLGSGQEIVCGAGQSHYSIGTITGFTHGNFFSRYVGESNTLLPNWQAHFRVFSLILISSVN
jgi:hypothetical protein